MNIKLRKSILGISILSASVLFTGCGSNEVPMESAKKLDLNKLKEQYPNINIT